MSDAPQPKKRATVASVDRKIDDLVEVIDIMSTNVRQIKAALEAIWIFWGREVHDELHDEIYVQFISNVLSALVTAGMIGLYHVIFHA